MAWARRHDLLAGVDIYQEDAKRANNFPGPSSGLTTTVGTPNDGDSFADARGAVPFNTFDARNIGLYVQDTVSLNSTVKLIGGLRYDHFKATYVTSTGVANDVSAELVEPARGRALPARRQHLVLRLVRHLVQHLGRHLPVRAGRSPTPRTANTPPEKSRNLEIGGKFELFDEPCLASVRRSSTPKSTTSATPTPTPPAPSNCSPASATPPAWSSTSPAASRRNGTSSTTTPGSRAPKIDKSNVGQPRRHRAASQGDRPGLTPKHSASLWTTYRVAPKWRIGGRPELPRQPEPGRQPHRDRTASPRSTPWSSTRSARPPRSSSTSPT